MNEKSVFRKNEGNSRLMDATGKPNEVEMRYRSLFEQSPDGILLIDTDGTVIDFNRTAHTMLGYTKEEFEHIHISRLSLQEPDEIQACIRKMHQSGKAEFEARYKTKDGTIKNVYVNSTMISLSGKPVMHSIWRDITERKKIEENLQKSEKFVRGILESVDEGFIVIDHDLKILSVNNAYLKLASKREDQVVGRHCYEISHQSPKPCYYYGEDCPVRQTFLSGNPSLAIHVHRDNEGKALHTEVKSFPLKDGAGNTTSAIEIINNTTERRKLEDQLRHAQKMEAVGHLAGGIAHDFNNILTAIMGYASIIRMKLGEQHPMHSHVREIIDASQRAANLTRGLLAFSRKQELRTTSLDINTVVEGVEKLLRRLIGEEIEVSVRVAGLNLNVTADRGQIEQVLMNLATNAKDAMPNGGKLSIQTDSFVMDQEFIKAHGYGREGEYAVIIVTDTGVGIEEKIKIHIFEPFFTTKPTGKGTGLGLSIAYGIVKQHEGFITCYSELGKGTAFRIFLPLSAPDADIVHESESSLVSGGTEAVLVAEDDATLRSLVREILDEFGYSVIEAVDGEDAVIQFKANQEKLQLLVFDIMMPKKNGIEAYEEILKLQPDIKAIFTSGYTAGILQSRGIIEKDLNFVAKPVAPYELLRKIREVLDKRQ